MRRSTLVKARRPTCQRGNDAQCLLQLPLAQRLAPALLRHTAQHLHSAAFSWQVSTAMQYIK